MQSTNGQHSTLGNLKKLVDEFESALRKHKIEIKRNSSLEAACLCVTELLDIWPIKHCPDGALQFGSIKNEERDKIPLYLNTLVTSKSEDVAQDIGVQAVWDFFSGKKTMPGFLAFCQSAAGVQNKSGVVIPSSILKLTLSPFRDLSAYEAIFSQMNNALHERIKL
jgi:hypothetical protein